MSRRRILAVSLNLHQLRVIVSHLERAGAEVDAIQDLGDKIRHRYVFCAIGDHDPPDFLDNLLKKLHPEAHVVVVAANAKLPDLVQYLTNRQVNHVIVGDAIDPGVLVTAQKLLSGDIFGIEKYVPPNTPIHYVRLRDFEGRKKAIDTILAFAEENNVRRQIRNSIGQVCEELLMNALYDAPVDDHGSQVFADVEPHERTKARSPKPVSIRFAVTESCFAIAVRDRFGRLAKDTILGYLAKCLTTDNQIDRKAYGAGLGLYMVANATVSYVVNVAYDVATEVICTFDRKSKTPLRLVGIFVHPDDAENLVPPPG